jgi:hypothetical protein
VRGKISGHVSSQCVFVQRVVTDLSPLNRILLFEMKLKSILGVEYDDENWAFVPVGCDALMSRIEKNFGRVGRIFSVHYDIHHEKYLNPFVEAALKH